jgi:monothiol glutaredoxin
MTDTQNEIKNLITQNKVVIFMKGTPQAPQCGFSAQAVRCLDSVGAPLVSVDIFAQPALRDGIKQFTNWPTIPQVFINGEFIGGCDIVTELYQRGELKEMVDAALKS